MARQHREPNRRLAAVMLEAGVSNKGLAKRIVDATARDAEPVRADHNDVRKWLEGMVPRAPKPQLIARVLSQKLNRRVSLDDLGLGAADTSDDESLLSDGLTYPDEPSKAVDLLRRLTEADLADRRPIVDATASTAVAPQIITGYLFAGPVLLIPEQDGPIRGNSAAGRIRDTTAHFLRMDFQYGGGHTRRMLLQFFRDQVVPLLTKHHPAPVRREVFSAAAGVAQLLGWSAYDAGRHGVAMRYFTQGLKLAREADDRLLGARMLSSLSHQANFLGWFSDAVNFARAAQSATQGCATNTVSSMFLAMEARGLASLGDNTGATSALSHAEKLFEARHPDVEPEWIAYFDALELAGEAAHIFRDLGDASRTKLFTSQAIDPDLTPGRTRAFIQMVSAAGSLSAGEPEEAIVLATEAIELADGLQSDRYMRYLADFHRSLSALSSRSTHTAEFTSLLTTRYPVLRIPGND